MSSFVHDWSFMTSTIWRLTQDKPSMKFDYAQTTTKFSSNFTVKLKADRFLWMMALRYFCQTSVFVQATKLMSRFSTRNTKDHSFHLFAFHWKVNDNNQDCINMKKCKRFTCELFNAILSFLSDLDLFVTVDRINMCCWTIINRRFLFVDTRYRRIVCIRWVM